MKQRKIKIDNRMLSNEEVIKFNRGFAEAKLHKNEVGGWETTVKVGNKNIQLETYDKINFEIYGIDYDNNEKK